MIPTLSWTFSKVPYPDFKSKTVADIQSVGDIEKLVKECSKESLPYCGNYAYAFQGRDHQETCENIYNFMRRYFTYDEEPERRQTGKTVNRILYDKTGDCKHYSTFAYCTLKALGVPCNFRLCQYDGRDAPSHIYVVAYDGSNEIIIDGTLTRFNNEISSKFIFDV